jgi:hypothetical protein
MSHTYIVEENGLFILDFIDSCYFCADISRQDILVLLIQ